MYQYLKQPIIVTGPPRSGTTLLAGILNWHPQIGPKPEPLTRYKDPQEFLRQQGFGPMTPYQGAIEQHAVWRSYFATPGGFRDLHRQVHVHLALDADPDTVLLQACPGLKEHEIPLVKSPELLFALPAVQKAWPEALVLVMLRDPVEIFASLAHYRMYSAPPIEGFRLESEEGVFLFRRRLNGFLDVLEHCLSRGTAFCVWHRDLYDEDMRRSCLEEIPGFYAQPLSFADGFPHVYLEDRCDLAPKRLGGDLSRITAALQGEQARVHKLAGGYP